MNYAAAERNHWTEPDDAEMCPLCGDPVDYYRDSDAKRIGDETYHGGCIEVYNEYVEGWIAKHGVDDPAEALQA